MNKYYHRGNGEVICPHSEYKSYLVDFNWHIESLPIYAYCNPKNPVGWIEGEEVYQVKDPLGWLAVLPSSYAAHATNNRRIWIVLKQGIKRNVSIGQEATSFVGAMEITNYDNQTFQINQPDFQREAWKLYPDMTKSPSGGISMQKYNDHQDTARWAHIKARQMSAGEVGELRMENERLRTCIKSIFKESENAMLRNKTSFMKNLERFSSRKNAYKTGWRDCFNWVKSKTENNIQ